MLFLRLVIIRFVWTGSTQKFYIHKALPAMLPVSDVLPYVLGLPFSLVPKLSPPLSPFPPLAGTSAFSRFSVLACSKSGTRLQLVRPSIGWAWLSRDWADGKVGPQLGVPTLVQDLCTGSDTPAGSCRNTSRLVDRTGTEDRDKDTASTSVTSKDNDGLTEVGSLLDWILSQG